jgi:ABC-type phosphate/phosphonate transport system substrate-binding protein
MLAQLGETPARFFRRYIFTYSRSASVEAVAVKFVDAASVDSYVYDYLAATQPALTARTQIIARSPAHGITTMPFDAIGSLTPEQYWNVVAFVLSENHYLPPGTTLGPANAKGVKIAD